ncbi:hypothetical protein V8D89_003371 [Ganoderma adspersum]
MFVRPPSHPRSLGGLRAVESAGFMNRSEVISAAYKYTTVHTYLPLLAQYLWMKIDFVAMAEAVEDPEALAAAEKLAQEGKTYLVFVRFNCEPSTGFDWSSGYVVDIVTRGPRRVDDTEGPFSSDMFVPVYPFTHPEHQSLRPEPALPFPDCTHWLGSTVNVAVQRVSEALNKEWNRYNVKFLENSAGVARSTYFVPTSTSQAAPCGLSSSPIHDTTSDPHALQSSGPQTVEDNPDPPQFIPVVNVGVDIDQRFSESDPLPTVYDFFEEREKLKRVLSAALDRDADLERRAVVSSSSTTQHSDSPG